MAALLDFNHREKKPDFADAVNALIDAALTAENAGRPARDYLGGSRLGDACQRRLQYEYLKVAKDDGADFTGRSLRIFALGHVLEDLAIDWLRKAGFDLRTRNRHGEQFGFSAAGGRLQGHADGVIVAALNGMAVPALWECKSANAKNWREIGRRGVVKAKPIYAAQIALYQAYLGLTEAPALFTAINKDSCEIWHELVPFDAERAQAASDKAVRILRACDAGELLPRHTEDTEHFECRFCAWKERCWA
ncbi:PD-(D/E)XK nuclease superfamily protein [Ruegeria intermedia]|uniref:PD-(D/E)XK nuclease superfamily protein n=1 Tax=Ruegeria intermedia TaxID=996115 RepID=A0A1M5BDZ5_9RHOB|nr:PD-(D/E)XK nuclease family protein [Ruegeria intermedia]SHF40392.1 PD-(D/E)XK nuclease superfamily protein [Ruegeria intermedia]